MFKPKTVLVKFTNGSDGEYAYLTELQVAVGDLVVVEARDTYSAARVTKIAGLTRSQRDKAHKYIVQLVDIVAHEERRAKAETAGFLLSELDEILEQEDRLERYKRLASESPRAKEILDTLTNTIGIKALEGSKSE